MDEITAIARPYARAVARLAREAGEWKAWSGMLARMARVASDPKITLLARAPGVPPERMAEIVLTACGGRLNADGANFIRLLAARKRLGCLPEISRLFEEIRAEREGVLAARVITAYPLTEAQLSALVTKLEARFGRRIQASQDVDISLIGGMVVQVGDAVLDASMRGRLAAVAATLAA